MGIRGGNSRGSSSIESKWQAAMETELGEKDFDAQSEGPHKPTATGDSYSH